MNNKETNIDDLSPNSADFLTSYAKSGLGAIPYFGTLFGEVLGQIIPNQRVDRMVQFLSILDKKLNDLTIDIEDINAKMKDEKYINLFEEGIWQASKTSSKERKEYIASILKNGLTDEALNEIQKGIFLSLLSELNDIEVIILYSYTRNYGNNKEIRDELKHIIEEPISYLGADEKTINDSILYDTYKAKLLRLNLLKDDKYIQLTGLGRLFLNYIDMPDKE